MIVNERYLAFAGHDYYPNGGYRDLKGHAMTLKEAREIAKNQDQGYWDGYETGSYENNDWYQIVHVTVDEHGDFNFKTVEEESGLEHGMMT